MALTSQQSQCSCILWQMLLKALRALGQLTKEYSHHLKTEGFQGRPASVISFSNVCRTCMFGQRQEQGISAGFLCKLLRVGAFKQPPVCWPCSITCFHFRHSWVTFSDSSWAHSTGHPHTQRGTFVRTLVNVKEGSGECCLGFTRLCNFA